ncbi:MAG: hypothetical protein NVS3B1_11710 [Marmoricola sp.]
MSGNGALFTEGFGAGTITGLVVSRDTFVMEPAAGHPIRAQIRTLTGGTKAGPTGYEEEWSQWRLGGRLHDPQSRALLSSPLLAV